MILLKKKIIKMNEPFLYNINKTSKDGYQQILAS